MFRPDGHNKSINIDEDKRRIIAGTQAAIYIGSRLSKSQPALQKSWVAKVLY